MGLIKKAKKEKKETIEAAYEVEKSLLGSGQFATVHRGQPKAAGRTCLAPDGSERQVPTKKNATSAMKFHTVKNRRHVAPS